LLHELIAAGHAAGVTCTGQTLRSPRAEDIQSKLNTLLTIFWRHRGRGM